MDDDDCRVITISYVQADGVSERDQRMYILPLISGNISRPSAILSAPMTSIILFVSLC